MPFELIQIEVQCSKNYFKIFLLQETEAFGSNIEKEPQKSHPKLKRFMCYISTENVCSACDSMQVVIYCKNVLTLQNNDLNFVTLKVT